MKRSRPDRSPRVADRAAPELVVLLHGVGMRGWTMKRFERAFVRDGYRVVNLSYPSRTLPLAKIGPVWLKRALAEAEVDRAPRVHFVTHSMGGIVLRDYFRRHRAGVPGHVVMLGPPNAGSEIVDRLGGTILIHAVVGPNVDRLGTGRNSFPRKLGPWPRRAGRLGIIAGTRTFNPLFSKWIPGPDDGEVSVESARLKGMSDFVEVYATHISMLWNREVVELVRRFVRTGRFDGPSRRLGPAYEAVRNVRMR